MIDPFGAVLTLIRSDAAVAAITTRVSSEVQALPCVQLIDNATSREPFGPGSGRMQMQYWTGIGRAWAADTPAGAILARQLAGCISDALHGHRPVTVGTRYMARSYASDIEGGTRDPQTSYPFVDVLIEAYFAAEPV